MPGPSLIYLNNCVHISVSPVHHQSLQHPWRFHWVFTSYNTPRCSSHWGAYKGSTQDVILLTMPTFYLPLLSKLLTINSFSCDSLVHSTPNKFAQQEIEMRSYVASNKGHCVSKRLTLISQFIRDNPSASAVVFCNSRKQSQHLRGQLEHKLNELKLNIDVMHINGTLHKIDRFWRIRLFRNSSHLMDADFVYW